MDAKPLRGRRHPATESQRKKAGGGWVLAWLGGCGGGYGKRKTLQLT